MKTHYKPRDMSASHRSEKSGHQQRERVREEKAKRQVQWKTQKVLTEWIRANYPDRMEEIYELKDMVQADPDKHFSFKAEEP